MKDTKYLPLQILDKVSNPALDNLQYIDKSSPDAMKHLQTLMVTLLPKEWAKMKKVYCPDEDFVKSLIDTENVKIYPHTFKHLPYPFIYIDLSYCESIQVMGIFLKVEVSEDDPIRLYFSTIEKNGRVTGSIHTLPKERIIQDKDYGYYKVEREDCHSDADHLNPKTKSFEKYELDDTVSANILFFIYQFLLYISTPEADIEENEFSKKHFKESQIHKNRIAAVQKWDVGVRYGNKFRRKKAIEEELLCHREITKSTKRPHVRCAHWQHYRVGVGRNNLILKWIEPTFVNGNVDDIISTIIPVSEQERIGYKGEIKLGEYLDSKGINYRAQHYIGSIGKRYDVSFRIDDGLYFIEFDGEQHFKSVECWGGEKAYLNRIIADTQKTNYCRQNKIPFLRIRYDQIANIPDMIDDLILRKEKYLNRFNTYLTDAEYNAIRE